MDNVAESLEVTSEFREPFRLHIVSTALFQPPDAEKLHLYPLRAANVISIMANEQTATNGCHK